jgi:cytochrome c oxidase subunit II
VKATAQAPPTRLGFTWLRRGWSGLAGLVLAACNPTQSALHPAGPQAARIAALWWLMFWVCVAIFAAVVVGLLAAALRGRRRGRADAAGAPMAQELPEGGKAAVVAVCTAVTAVVLFVLLVASIMTDRGLAMLATHDALTVEITGHQWWWEVQYDASVPAERVTTANEIHIPVGQPVLLKLTSHDVIHSFWTPNLHGKTDLIPGYVTRTWIQADAPGTFRGQCAEFCGVQHAHMALVVVAEPAEKFQAWLTQERRAAAAPVDPLAQRGHDVFVTGPCVLCHAIRGTIAMSRAAPDLTHVAGRGTLAAGTVPNTPGHLAGWILDPQGTKPGALMPATSLGSEDLQALLAYLGTLR